MAQVLSIDLGTTYSAAAFADGVRLEMLSLGTRSPTIPSMVALRPDTTVLVGEAAERRLVDEPTRVAREFKRRLGDPVPIILGGTPYGAETLMAHLLRWIVDRAVEQKGGAPERLVLTHPADYGPYKLDLLEQVGRRAGVEPIQLLSEPEAAAVHYSGLERTEPGDVVAVYDLGGGTFDAALVRRTDTGFELIGTPEGMDRFGGIDIDEAVFAHVRDVLGGTVDELDADDPSAMTALARLREDCRVAKEALSADTEAVVPVMLPNVHTDVRLTRTELEDMIRPRLRETIATLERVVQSAGLAWGDLSRVLLVGGSSRIPLVGEIVRASTGCQVVLDTHPKHAIALGAAAAGLAGAARTGERATAERDHRASPVAPAAGARGSGADRISRAPLGTGVARRLPALAAAAAAVVVLGIAASVLTGAFSAGGTIAPRGGPTLATSTAEPSPPEPAPAGLLPVVGEPPSQLVLARYRADYANPELRADWGAWARGADGDPPADISAAYYPTLGPYDSTDRAVIAQHLAWLRQAGIGGIVVPWTGPDGPTAAAIPELLNLGRRYGVRVTFSIPLGGTGPDELPGSVEQLLGRYGDHPALLRTTAIDRDGRVSARPLFVLVPPSEPTNPESWAAAIATVRGMGAGLAVVVASNDPTWTGMTGADGLIGGPSPDGDYGWATRLPTGAWYIPSLSPGSAGAGDVTATDPRTRGERYEQRWVRAIAPRDPTFYFVNSFNDWALGTQIEPATVDVPERATAPYLTYEPLPPQGYLDLTRQLVDAHAR